MNKPLNVKQKINGLRWFKTLSLFIWVCICCLLSNPIQAQHNVLGRPGYIFTPKGHWSSQPKASLGFVLIPQSNAINYFMSDFHEELMYHAGVDITDFFRINLNMTYLLQVDRIGVGDRHLDFSLRLIKENTNTWRPDLSLFFSLPQINSPADYLSHHALVLTKTLDLTSNFSLTASAGYGIPVFLLGVEGTDRDRQPLLPGFVRKERINNFYLNGFFGAAQISYQQIVGLVLEHDGRGLHAGAFANLWKEKLSFQVNAFGLKNLGYGFHLNLPLDVKPRELRRAIHSGNE